MDPADGALQFSEAKVGAVAAGPGSSSALQPTEAGGVFAAVDRLMGFAVVFEGPRGIPEIGKIDGRHAAFAGDGEDLVLAEAPGGHITEASHGLAVDADSVDLGAGFDHGDAVGVGQLEDRGHIGWLGVNPSPGSDATSDSSRAANRVSPQRNT